MQRVEEPPLETIHLYVVREEEPKPSLLPIILSVIALSILIALGVLVPSQQPEIRTTIRVPAVPSFIKTFSAAVTIVPTGARNYPATVAHGVLNISNGSVISQTLPAGFIVTATNGTQVATDVAVFVPAATANGFGMETVTAHIAVASVNLPTLAINQVIGTSLFIRNLEPFTGGHPAYSVQFATRQDHLKAIEQARSTLAPEIWGLHYPCIEKHLEVASSLKMTWLCQFVTYSIPSYMHAIRVVLQGNDLLVDVVFVARPKWIWLK
jgi:hypothetical protein